MSVLDRIAEDNIDLIEGEEFEEDGSDARLLMSKTISEPVTRKTASCVFERVQQIAEDMHQDAKTGDFWKIKKGHLIRTVANFIKE